MRKFGILNLQYTCAVGKIEDEVEVNVRGCQAANGHAYVISRQTRWHPDGTRWVAVGNTSGGARELLETSIFSWPRRLGKIGRGDLSIS